LGRIARILCCGSIGILVVQSDLLGDVNDRIDCRSIFPHPEFTPMTSRNEHRTFMPDDSGIREDYYSDHHLTDFAVCSSTIFRME
jgi:hypothetical protein